MVRAVFSLDAELTPFMCMHTKENAENESDRRVIPLL